MEGCSTLKETSCMASATLPPAQATDINAKIPSFELVIALAKAAPRSVWKESVEEYGFPCSGP